MKENAPQQTDRQGVVLEGPNPQFLFSISNRIQNNKHFKWLLSAFGVECAIGAPVPLSTTPRPPLCASACPVFCLQSDVCHTGCDNEVREVKQEHVSPVFLFPPSAPRSAGMEKNHVQQKGYTYKANFALRTLGLRLKGPILEKPG